MSFSIRLRSAVPSSVRTGSTASSPAVSAGCSRPRSASPATAAFHSAADQPRLPRAKATVNPVPVAVAVTRASSPDSPASTSSAMCPSPRCSRRIDNACQRTRCGAVGQGTSRCPAASGRPSGVTASAAVRASPAASAISGEATVSSPRVRRSEASATANRTSSRSEGDASSQARGTDFATSRGEKL